VFLLQRIRHLAIYQGDVPYRDLYLWRNWDFEFAIFSSSLWQWCICRVSVTPECCVLIVIRHNAQHQYTGV